MAGSSDNNWSTGGSPDDLPDLPEEWGVIVIPDDLAELDDEVKTIRRELEQERNPTRWQRFTRRPAVRRARRVATAALRAPVLIISMAVLVTIASLFASAWPGPARLPATQRTSGTEKPNATPTRMPSLEAYTEANKLVTLTSQLPAVILLVDGCACERLVDETVSAVNPRITVVTVAGKTAGPTPRVAVGRQTPPTGTTPQAQGKTVRTLHDPAGAIRDELKIPPADGTAAALLVDSTGTVIRVVARTMSIDDLRPDLARL